ncbi:PolC-type DNA polymerase III [Mycoplasmopsis caviae]|uniref:DNA polymerase III PolC-type n=1 Tax=Mycoplasmopsis caviae TaxID=55603 RepID=A0A3P8L702_9BACT|nr:PolC-type DNA polymerase III [Mycoplasmopsis caviae]UUD35345.1 PolC-type DNA polymerase III [Mycoplasmopsis caviae]VDR41875.1 DNA polymerase III polC-type [Mycoplasmopsis caviae]
MSKEIRKIENENFKILCKDINVKVTPELEKVELETYHYDELKDQLNVSFRFTNSIKAKDFFSFLSCLKNNNVYNIKGKITLDISQYKKENLIDFINELTYEKAKFIKLRDLSILKKMKFSDQFVATISVMSQKEYDEYKSLFKELERTLIKYGWKDLKINFELKTMVSLDKKALEEEKKKTLEFMRREIQNQEKINKANETSKSSGFNSRWRKRSYEKVELESLSSMDDKSAVSFTGMIYSQEYSLSKNGKHIYTFFLTNYKDAVEVKTIRTELFEPEQISELANNKWVTIYGTIAENTFGARSKFVFLDFFEKSGSLLVEKAENSKLNKKRVELHVSSKMNTMDGLIFPKDIFAFAEKMNHPAVAIMDVDGAQGYPEFYNASKKSKVKPLYGTAFSVINKKNRAILGNVPTGEIKGRNYVSFDIETTGLIPRYYEIIEYGSMSIISNNYQEKKQFFIKCKEAIKPFTENLTGITNSMVQSSGIELREALRRIFEDLDGKIALAHNARFDLNFLKEKFRQENMKFPNVTVIDTLIVSRIVFPQNKRHKLEDVATRVGVEYDPTVAHRGDYDAKVLAEVWIALMDELSKNGITTFEQLNSCISSDLYNKTFSYEVSTIAKNYDGLKEQYAFLTTALTKNLYNGPKTFIEDLANRSSNLLLGSGTLKSRLLDTYFYSSHEEFLKELALYDYVEIPAPQVFSHWISNQLITQEQLEISLKEIISEALRMNKIVVAVADVKYLNLYDKVAYEVLVYAKGIKNARHYLFNYEQARSGKIPIPNQDFLTTEEMLEQFAFLNDKELIENIVINNTNKIADMCDRIQIIKDKLYTPDFENSGQKLHDLVYETAHKKYGKILPEIIQKRIEAELNPIIKYGFSVIYWISHILIKKSIENGFVVGSRGSVGSSFVANLAGISEVNPLVPHYLCNKCKYFEIVQDDKITSGYDLPNKKCPKCSTKLEADGQSIPFETFLGFKADKVPDIDLNFSGDIQGDIHNEVKRIFGNTHTLKAGTISTVALKTSYGHVKAFTEEAMRNYSEPFIDFLAHKIEKLKRTTGQHPGGILIIPKEFDVYDFTPINYPANESDSTWLTSHFDFHSIHDNILKLDLLGHDNPTIIRLLKKYTGINIEDIPKNDPNVLSLFTSPKAMNIKPEQINNESTGALGLPEFGTNFVRQMLKEAKPKTFANLISLSGLSHGENVWLNNAQDLINKRKFDITDVISCRDDIMEFLLRKKVEPLFAFNIMEKVRKGKGLTEDEEKKLKEYKVADWMIESMKKIKYMFPKAHATAYVLMAWWIAWFKLYYPLAHYASYFATHARAVEIENMIDIKGGHKVTDRLNQLNNIPKNERKVKDDDLIPVFEIAQELYARGFYISNISLKKSEAHEWVIDNENKCLIPPFKSIDGLGDAVALSLVEARNFKPFSSKEDVIRRSSVNKSLVEKMEKLNIFKGLDETDQLKLF